MGSGKPSVVRVQLDLLIVHRGLVWRKDAVWFYVYEGSLADAMISDDMLNDIPCLTAPGTKLVDTRARPDDMSILLRQINDYQDMCNHRVNVAMAVSTGTQNQHVDISSESNSASTSTSRQNVISCSTLRVLKSKALPLR